MEGFPMNSTILGNVEIVEQKHSQFGIASFIISLLAAAALCATLVFSILLPNFLDSSVRPTSLINSMVGIVFCGFVLVGFVGIGLGIAGLFEKNRKPVFAILGIVFSSATVLVMVGQYIIGSLIEHP
jgi:hypothetical protein